MISKLLHVYLGLYKLENKCSLMDRTQGWEPQEPMAITQLSEFLQLFCDWMFSLGVFHSKPVKSQGWWKGKFALFWMPETEMRGGWTPIQRLTPPTPNPLADNHWARTCIDRGRKPHVETSDSPPTVILKFVMWWANQHHLDCVKYN